MCKPRCIAKCAVDGQFQPPAPISQEPHPTTLLMDQNQAGSALGGHVHGISHLIAGVLTWPW